jgi:EAL domain-containing protein (putative c-di-GMP-specific phosphodiesterase class I)
MHDLLCDRAIGGICMSTKERLYNLIDVINPKDFDIVLQILERFAMTNEERNEDTIDDMNEETRAALDDIENGRNLSRAFYSVEELMEDLNAED